MAKSGLALVLALLVLLPVASAAKPPEFEVLYSERVAQFDGEGSLEEGASKSFKFLVSQPNVTRITFLLTWTETGDKVRFSGPDSFSLSVDAPKGSGFRVPTERSDSGKLLVRADDINKLPEGGPVAEDQVADMMSRNEGLAGLGEWRATVKLHDVANPEGAKVDEGNDFTLQVYLHYYEAFPMRVVTLTTPSHLAAFDESDAWGMATAALAVAVLGLGVVLMLQQRRRSRVSRASVTSSAHDSPRGETQGPPDP